MNNLAPLTEAEVKELAAEWYQKLDIHAPVEDYIPFLVEEGFEIHVPEGIFRGFEGFKSWYENALSLFFDEVHTIKNITLTSVSGEKAEVKIIVNWQASTWNPPAPKSRFTLWQVRCKLTALREILGFWRMQKQR